MGILFLNQDYQFRIHCLISIIYIYLHSRKFYHFYTCLDNVFVLFSPLAFLYWDYHSWFCFCWNHWYFFWVGLGFLVLVLVFISVLLVWLILPYFVVIFFFLLLFFKTFLLSSIYYVFSSVTIRFFSLSIIIVALVYFGIIARKYALKSFKQF